MAKDGVRDRTADQWHEQSWFGMPTKVIAERQLNLSFLNTAIDRPALVVFGLGL